MAAEDVARAAETIGQLLGQLKISVDPGFTLAVVGLVVLMIFGIAAVGFLLYRVFTAIANMTPGRFLVAVFISAWVLLLLGSLLP